MRIAFCVLKNLMFGGGIEKYTLELGSRLVRRGHEVTVYSMRHYGQLPDQYRGMNIVGVPCLRLRSSEKLTAAATAAMMSVLDRRLDIVHFHDIGPGAFALLPRLIGRHRCILQFHGLAWQRSRWGRSGVWVHKILERLAVRQSHAYTAVSKVQCEYFRARYGLDVSYIPTGAPVGPSVPPQEILKLGIAGGSYVLFASRLVREKGLHYLIPAFRRLNTPHKLVIAGDACDPAYRKELEALSGGDERIMYLGMVHGRALAELFSNALVYVQPSETEGLSIALLEAMGYGNRCLVSDIPANLEAIADTGWHFRNKSVESLSERLGWLLDHPDETRHQGEAARRRVKQHYSWDTVAESFERLYEGLLLSRAA